MCFHKTEALIRGFSSCSEVILSDFPMAFCELIVIFFLIDERYSAPVAKGFKTSSVIRKWKGRQG